jgi:gas vesicle protein
MSAAAGSKQTTPNWQKDLPMVMPTCWVSLRAVGTRTLAIGLVLLTLAGCRNNPTNPFLAREDSPYPGAADDASPNDPLTASLGRLKNRSESLAGAAAMATDAAQGIRDEAMGIAQDTVSETRQAVATSLDDAKQRGQQLAYDAVVAAGETARAASHAAQVEAIHSLEELPLEQAGPLLIVAIARGTPAVQQAASEQLARRWPPAASFPADSAAEAREAALAELHRRWAEQYGQIDEAVAAAKLEVARHVDQATQLVDQAHGVVSGATQQLKDMQQLVASYRQATLPVERQELARALAQLSTDADAAVRIRAAEAMGELGDPVFLPALVAMLNDNPQVQAATLASLDRVAGPGTVQPEGGHVLSNEEKVVAWQQWYKSQQAAREDAGQ